MRLATSPKRALTRLVQHKGKPPITGPASLFIASKNLLEALALFFSRLDATTKSSPKLKGRPIIIIMRPKASLTGC